MSATTAPAPTAAAGEYQVVSLALLEEHPLNPRRHFDAARLEELTSSIREKGILSPLLVRRVLSRPNLQILGGARRYRAAKKIGLKEVPTIIRDLDDKAALELMMVDNLQREDVHPLEEADGYHQLHLEHGYAIEDLAAKLGKSKAYVYARMKLSALQPGPRKLFLAGKLSPSTALLVARIPGEDLQLQAGKAIAEGRHPQDGPMSFREASDYVQHTFMLRLADAGFPTTDATLVPAAGPCTTCPKRTGNQRELFDDVKSADVCTDVLCFRSKRDAAFARQATAAQAQGAKVLSPAEAAKVLQNGHVRYESMKQYVTAGESCPEDGYRRTYGAILGKKAAPAVVLAQEPETGATVTLLARGTLPRLLKDAGVKRPSTPTSVDNSRWAQQQRDREKKAKAESAARRAILLAIHDRVPATLGVEDLRIIAHGFVEEVWSENRMAMCRLFGWKEDTKGFSPATALRKKIDSLKLDGLGRLLVTMALVRNTTAGPYSSSPVNRLNEAAKRYKVKTDAIRREITAAAKAKSKRPKKAKARARSAA